jgi:hypothetical protein
MSSLITPVAERPAVQSGRPPARNRRFLPLLLAGAMAAALWVIGGGERAAPPPTGIVAPPIHDPTTSVASGTTTAIDPTTEVVPVRPSMEEVTALGPRGLEPSGLVPVVLFDRPGRLITDSTGTLWWETGWGLARFDPERGSSPGPSFFSATDDVFFASLTTIAPARHEGVWAAARDSTLRRFDGQTFVEVIQTPEPLCQVVESEQLGLWGVGCEWAEWSGSPSEERGWLYRWDGGQWEADPQGRPHPGAAELTIDSSGKVWVANCEEGKSVNTDGVSVFDGTAWTTFTSHDGLPTGVIQRIAGDVNGELWVATVFGPSTFDGTTWSSPTVDPEPDRRRWRGLQSILAVSGDAVAITDSLGTRLVRIIDDEIVEIPLATQSVSNLAAANGRAWLVVDGALHRIDDDTVIPVPAAAPPTAPGPGGPAGPSIAQITAISASQALVLADGQPWRCSVGDGCAPSLVEVWLTDVIVGFDGRVLALGNEQLLWLDGDEWHPLTPFAAWEALRGR